MAQRQLELSSERFRSELDAEDDKLVRATSLNDVRATIAQTETQLASRQGLRNFDRLSPYINAAERYGKVLEVFCNSSPMVSYIWAIKEQTRALDLILDASAQIGNALPRLSALQDSLKDNHDFQLLFTFLYEDITEFHRRVYRIIRKRDRGYREAVEVLFCGSMGNLVQVSSLQSSNSFGLNLRFEGEDKSGTQHVVERRLVLDYRD
ncbi:nacht domain-containing protein [Diaporthe eres]|nr:nacht domain-containing protein [Diaporthe eres]